MCYMHFLCTMEKKKNSWWEVEGSMCLLFWGCVWRKKKQARPKPQNLTFYCEVEEITFKGNTNLVEAGKVLVVHGKVEAVFWRKKSSPANWHVWESCRSSSLQSESCCRKWASKTTELLVMRSFWRGEWELQAIRELSLRKEGSYTEAAVLQLSCHLGGPRQAEGKNGPAKALGISRTNTKSCCCSWKIL